MKISDFIVVHFDEVLIDWLVFVRRNVAIAEDLEDGAIRDQAESLLRQIADAVRRQKDPPSQPAAQADEIAAAPLGRAACAHAATRVLQGFTLEQMVAEYRALRSNVILRWTRDVSDFSREAHDDQIRFNDALDRALVASTAHYVSRLEMARDLFLGVLGHDLRTPLAAIIHSTALLRFPRVADDLRQEAVGRVSNSAMRMDRMIQDLLDLTRTRQGTRLPMKPCACNLEEIGKQALDELAAFHPGAKVLLKSSGHLQGTWDSERITQLLSNLVDNAIRHSAPDAPVTVELSGSTDTVHISVHNIGKAIPPAEQRMIFDPFKRGVHEPQAGSGSRAGLGLGLYIALQIARAHGGSIRVSSSADAGTRFVVTMARHGGMAVT
jgi:signal transduction histidine kinase